MELRHVSWITAAFLLCGGDVEPNTDPDSCPVCSQHVDYDDEASVGALCSDPCTKWMHANCGGVNSEEFDELALSDHTVKWFRPAYLLCELPFCASELMTAADSEHSHLGRQEVLLTNV